MLREIKHKLLWFLFPIMFISIGVVGYQNYKRAEKVAELEVSNAVNESMAASYMMQFARCVKYVEIMHETCKCEQE